MGQERFGEFHARLERPPKSPALSRSGSAVPAAAFFAEKPRSDLQPTEKGVRAGRPRPEIKRPAASKSPVSRPRFRNARLARPEPGERRLLRFAVDSTLANREAGERAALESLRTALQTRGFELVRVERAHDGKPWVAEVFVPKFLEASFEEFVQMREPTLLQKN